MLRRAARGLIDLYMMSGDEADFSKRKTRFEKSRGRQLTVSWDDERKLFAITDPSGSVYVARKERVRLQNKGVAARRQRLVSEYLGGAELIRPGDVVVDCGANIGEFSVMAALKGATVHAFEPDPKEFAALKTNATGDMTVKNMALWHSTDVLTFYDNNDSGDSSLIDAGHAKSVLRVNAIRLDDYAKSAGITGDIRLLKIEAEGAEPEVLDGCSDLLDRVDYIAVDMGAEKGMLKENTVVPVMDRLTRYGFRLKFFESTRLCGLFARMTIPTTLAQDPSFK